MAHHGEDYGRSRMDLDKIFGKRGEKLAGATGQFPEGKLMDSDEGELRILIGHKDGKVVIDFGTPTTWIGFTADQANDIASMLQRHAAEIKAG